jgi:hypothetical protein
VSASLRWLTSSPPCEQINQLVLFALEAARASLWSGDGGGNGRSGHRSFNLFGFDFMIDARFKVCVCAGWALLPVWPVPWWFAWWLAWVGDHWWGGGEVGGGGGGGGGVGGERETGHTCARTFVGVRAPTRGARHPSPCFLSTQVWLIEINSSPGVAKQLLEPLTRDLIDTVILPAFPPQRPGGGTPRSRPRHASSSPLGSPRTSSSYSLSAGGVGGHPATSVYGAARSKSGVFASGGLGGALAPGPTGVGVGSGLGGGAGLARHRSPSATPPSRGLGEEPLGPGGGGTPTGSAAASSARYPPLHRPARPSVGHVEGTPGPGYSGGAGGPTAAAGYVSSASARSAGAGYGGAGYGGAGYHAGGDAPARALGRGPGLFTGSGGASGAPPARGDGPSRRASDSPDTLPSIRSPVLDRGGGEDSPERPWHPATNPAGQRRCGGECCQWGFQRIDPLLASYMAMAQRGEGVGLGGRAGVGVGGPVNVGR